MLWLWWRLAATAQIQPLAWEPPYAAGVALKDKKQTNKQKQHSSTPSQINISPHTEGLFLSVHIIQYNSLAFNNNNKNTTRHTKGLFIQKKKNLNIGKNSELCGILLHFIYFLMAVPVACGGSQARG